MESVHINHENPVLKQAYQKLKDELAEKSDRIVCEPYKEYKTKAEASKKPRHSAETKLIDHSIY